MSAQRPDRNGKFREVSLPFYGDVALGNGTQWKIGAFRTGQRLFVGIEGHGAYAFSHYIHRSYAEKKLGVTRGDSGNVADWINDQMPEEVSDGTRQGYYVPGLTEVAS